MKIKKPIISILAGLALLSFNTMAHGGETSGNMKESILSVHHQLSRVLSYPDYGTQPSGPQTVVVKFHVKNDFTVTVEEISNADPFLRNHVLKVLNSNKIMVDKDKVNQSFTVKLVFNY